MNISEKIIDRLKQNSVRFFSCDNVSDYISDDEKQELILELTDKFNDIVRSCIIDIENDPNSKETGKRLAKMYINELFEGRFTPRPDTTAFPNTGDDNYDGMITIRADIKSVCSHHWQPVWGTAIIGIIPDKQVLGLSKYIRIAQHEARRGTLQEELCQRIRKTISSISNTENVGVYLQAEHGCCVFRGVNASNSLTQTSSLGGLFLTDSSVKEEFYDNIRMQFIK